MFQCDRLAERVGCIDGELTHRERDVLFRPLPWEYGIRNLLRRPLRSALTLCALMTVTLLGLAVLALRMSGLSVGAEAVSIAFTASLQLAMAGILAAVAIGLLAGLIPAWHAARADIVRALRHIG